MKEGRKILHKFLPNELTDGSLHGGTVSQQQCLLLLLHSCWPSTDCPQWDPCGQKHGRSRWQQNCG